MTIADYIHIDTTDTCREDFSVPLPTEPDPAYMARLPELLAMRVGHLPLGASRGRWHLGPQLVVEDDGQCEYTDAHIRPIPPGLYLGLYDGPAGKHTVWMSDCPPEIYSMREGIDAIADPSCRRVLITGLGMGVIAQHALQQPHVERVDVVECDPDIIALIRHHYRGHGARLKVHRDDAYTIPLRGTWDVAYHDIWQHRTLMNIKEYVEMGRAWAGRARLQRFWPEAELAEVAARTGGREAELWGAFVALREKEGW